MAISIDGSFGEGGGQIIRTSVSLAAMTGHAVEIVNVRAKRTKPGLQPQHLAAVRAAAQLCGARLSGAEVGSSAFAFEPQHEVVAGDYFFDIGTAGAATLVTQTVLVPLCLAAGPSSVRVSGGTHVPHSPPVEYLEAVYVPLLREAGLQIELSYSSAGFYPRGGGLIEAQIEPSGAPQPLNLRSRGALKQLNAFVVTSKLPEHVAQRGAQTVEAEMKAIGHRVSVETREKPSSGPGAAVILATECERGRAAFSAVGELRRPMEKVAAAPCREFLEWWKTGAAQGAACDEHGADQLVLPMAWASGPSVWTTPVVSEHLRTVIWVVEQFLPVRARIEEAADGTATVEIKGNHTVDSGV